MKYICTLCGYEYDDSAQPVPFHALPENWKCPVCDAPVSAFRPDNLSEDLEQPDRSIRTK